MQKYFIEQDKLKAGIIDTDDAFHITTVMRSKIGDQILVGDNSKTYLAEIKSLSNTLVTFEIIEERTGNYEMPVFVTIFQGYPKGDKLEDVIKHGTELGASEFIPTIMKRSVFKLEPKKKASKLERFNKIAKEAAEQSFRTIIPSVPDIKYLKEINFDGYDVKILCYEESAKQGEASNFKAAVKNLKKGDKVAVLIGPEGGIDDSEVEYLESKGFVPCALGPRILRTETAIFYALSTISYEMELK
ncbi:MAG: 16S rRNA (uracil(1498)-N(3))-methyltransferase [Acholeplasmatales bacterium]|nr:16S rRNA (uracil(1498)-N(3))-methyltransferase [Acholeplasmatales bacterium]